MIHEYFHSIIGQPGSSSESINLSALQFPIVTLDGLVAPSSAEEILNVVRSLNPDKAPRPDGFNGKFYHICWHIIRDDVMAAFNLLWNLNDQGLHRINSANMILIPKSEDGHPPPPSHAGARVHLPKCLHQRVLHP